MARALLFALLALGDPGAPSPGAPSPGAPSPGQGAAPVRVVPRTDWDPAPLHVGFRYGAGAKMKFENIVVHHSDFEEPPGPLAIKAYHVEVSRFGDIGYHYVISPDGTVYAARDLDRMGAHAGATREAARGKGRHLDPDWASIGIVLDGHYMSRQPPPEQLSSLQALIRDLRARYPSIKRVLAHREVKPVLVEPKHLSLIGGGTTCPGDALYGWLAQEREAQVASAPPARARSGR